jgi:putative flippase GtrA
MQWIVGVVVAFFTNKKWVFTDAPDGRRNTAVQFGIFSFSRVGTYFLEVVLNLGAIGLLDILGYNDHYLSLGVTVVNLNSRLWAKIVSSIVVVIVNYIISKKWVFKSKK